MYIVKETDSITWHSPWKLYHQTKQHTRYKTLTCSPNTPS